MVASTCPGLSALLLASCLLAGCALTREKYERPAMPLPTAWHGGAGQQTTWPDQRWWEAFHADELNRLIAEAQDNNHDLKAAAARVREARAEAKIAGASLYPSLTLQAQATNANTTNPSNLRNSTTGTYNAYRVAPQVRYDIDLWGTNYFTAESADDAVLATTFGQEAVRITLTADVAATYFQVLSLSDRVNDAQRNLDSVRKTQGLVEAQRRAGRLSDFDVERQSAQLATSEAAVPPLQNQLQAARNALALLLGRNPGEVSLKATSLRDLAIPDVPTGLPAQLLERRPDIRQAEMNLIAANADVGAARAALFPSISLSALVGATGPLFGGNTPSARFHVITLGLLATIFDGGKLTGQLDLTKARKLELAEAYQQSILGGFRDVEDALAGVTHFSAEEAARREAVNHASEAYRMTDALLRAGARDFTSVLDAERTLLDAEAAADEARLSRFSSVVALYRALGGGWNAQSPVR